MGVDVPAAHAESCSICLRRKGHRQLTVFGPPPESTEGSGVSLVS
jgi:hypothetical protein